jgi:hypothetical protein
MEGVDMELLEIQRARIFRDSDGQPTGLINVVEMRNRHARAVRLQELADLIDSDGSPEQHVAASTDMLDITDENACRWSRTGQ